MAQQTSSSEYYKHHAKDYDASALRTMGIRYRTISKLQLKPGDCVVDVGCGTGLSLPILLDAIGSEGVLIGVEQSANMIELARQRMATADSERMSLIEASAEDVALTQKVDALLFHYTHDVTQSSKSLSNLFRFAKPGACVAVAGIKHPPRWIDPLRLYRRFKSRNCFNNPQGLDEPWKLLQTYVPHLQVEQTLWGTGFIAWGTT